jgi:hypothetical protein
MSAVTDFRRRPGQGLGDPAAFGGALLAYSLFYLGFFAQSLRGANEIAPGDALDFGLSTFLSPTTVWTDAMYSGYPIMADPQALSWYPVFQLMRALGFSWTLFEIAGYVLASTTAFLLVRRVTRSSIAGFFGGIVYGFSGIMLAHLNHFNQVHAAAWLPLVVYGLLLIRSDRYREGAAVGGFALGLMWSAGHPQLVVYGAYLCATLVAAWLWIDRPPSGVARRRVLWWGVAAALGVALAAVIILPAAELGALSRRAERDWNLYISMSLPPAQLLTLAFPMSFGGFSPGPGVAVPYAGAASLVEMGGYAGLLPLALTFLAVIAQSPWRREARLWAVLSIAAVMLCVGPATPVGTLFFYAPGYANFRAPVRHLFIVALCLSVASGIGLAEFMRNPGRHARIVVSALAAIVAAGLIGAGALSATGDSLRQLAQHPLYFRWAVGLPLGTSALAAAIVWAGANLVSKRILAAAGAGLLLLLVHLGDMLVVHYMLPGYHFGYDNVGPQLWQIRPEMAALRDELRKSGGRVLAADGSHNPLLRPNLTRAWRVPAASGSGSLSIERYATMLRMGGPGDVNPEVMEAPDRSLDLFAIQYVLIPIDMGGVDDLRRQPSRWHERATLKPDYLLFQNARSLPRAWCAPDIVRTDDPLGVIRSGRLSDGRAFEPTEVALVDVDALPHWAPAGAGTQSPHVDTRRLPGSEGEYEVDARDGDCLLVMSEVHYPWWRVSIDSHPAVPLRVNYTMMGLVVPRGRHIIRLWLEPRSAWIGGAVSAAALLAWMILTGSCLRTNGITRFEESDDAGPSADTQRNPAGFRPETSLHQTAAT